MKKKNHLTQYIRSLTLTLLFSVIFSVAAFASEKFVLTAIAEPYLILRTFELDRNLIKTVGSNLIYAADLDNYGIFQTAVAFRNDNNARVFDVYYGVCRDVDCIDATVSMKRLNSNLQLKSGQDFTIPVAYRLSTERLQTHSGVSLRLLIGKGNRGNVEERRLDQGGIPGDVVSRFEFQERSFYAAATEDGKMVVASGSRLIQIRSLHPIGPIKKDANESECECSDDQRTGYEKFDIGGIPYGVVSFFVLSNFP